MKDTLTVLREARAILEDEGRRTNHVFICRDGRCCVAGACGLAAGMSRDSMFAPNYRDYPAAVAAVKALAAHIAVPASQIGEEDPELDAVSWFNETPDHAEVLALFDKAIANEEAKQQPVSRSDTRYVEQAAPRRRDSAGCETRQRVAV